MESFYRAMSLAFTKPKPILCEIMTDESIECCVVQIKASTILGKVHDQIINLL
jgi:hypothetical protein